MRRERELKRAVVRITGHEPTGYVHAWARLVEQATPDKGRRKRDRLWIAYSYYMAPGKSWFWNMKDALEFVRSEGRLTVQKHYGWVTP